MSPVPTPNSDVILVDEPVPRVRRITMNRPEKRNSLDPPAARRDPRHAARARPGPRRLGHDHPRRGPVVLGRLRPRRRQRGPRDAVLHAGRRRRVAAPRHRGLDEHLGSRQAGDRAGARLLPRRRQRARDRLRPRLHGRGRADGLSRGALRRARHALPPVVPRHAQGDGDDAHRRLDHRASRRSSSGWANAAFPADELDERVLEVARPHRDGAARAAAAQQARRAPPDGRDGPARRHPRRHRAVRARHAHQGDARVRRRGAREGPHRTRCRSATRRSATTARRKATDECRCEVRCCASCGGIGSRRGGRTRSSASSCTGRRRRCRRSRRSTSRSASSCSRADATRSRGRRTPSGTRTRCASPTARSRATTARSTAIAPYADVRGRLGSRPRAVGSRRVGRARSPRPARATSCSSPSTTTATASGRPTSPTRTGRAGTAAATSSASWPRPCAARGCASASTTRAGSTGPSTTGRSDRWPRCSPRSRAATIPAYAEAQVRELIARYRPSVLWNDIAWPAEGKQLWPLFAHYYEQVPDGVVNDRWMPWSPLLGADAARAGRSASIDAGAQRQAQRDAGSSRRSRRTSTCARPSTSCSPTCSARRGSACGAWTRASATTRQSRPEHFLARDELLWSLRRHRRQGRQPAAQRRAARRRRADPRRAARPARLARGMGRHRTPTRSRATRPWVTPGTTTPTAPVALHRARRRRCSRSCATPRARSRCPTSARRRRPASPTPTGMRCPGLTATQARASSWLDPAADRT